MKRNRRCRLFPILILLGLPSALRADLASDIRATMTDKSFNRAEIGIEIIRLGDSPQQAKVLYEQKATTPRIPASNLKLITTATALNKLGAEFQFKTQLAGRGNDVALIGDGDPSFGDAEMLRKLGWGVDTVFKNWAQMLKSRGLSEVHNVYVDDSIFDENFLPPDWPADQQHKRYVAQVGGVNLNANCVDFFLRVRGFGNLVDYAIDPPTKYITVTNTCVMGQKNAVWLSRQLGTNDIVLRGETNVSNDEPVSVTIHDPPLFAATVLSETLQSNGIHVTGQVIRDRTIRTTLTSAPSAPTTASSSRWIAIAVHSTPLSAVLARANKDSMNLYAEAMCKRVGAQVSGTSGSWENGTAAVGAYLQSIGVNNDEFYLVDGCGLSKHDVISPHAIATVLLHKFHDPDKATYMNSLAVGGIDGTLENRFRDSDLRGRVFGKSGYVNAVRSLSGYLKARDGHWYVFSILMNNLVEGDVLAKQAQERIVRAIDRNGEAEIRISNVKSE